MTASTVQQTRGICAPVESDARVRPAPWGLPCPAWCTEHHNGGQVHTSEWILFQAGDSPNIWFQMARHDDNAGEQRFIGQTDFTIEVNANPGCYPAGDGELADGFLSCNELRELSRFLHDLAERADPNGTDGYDLEGYPPELITNATTVRRGQIAPAIPDGKARPCPNGGG